MDEKSINFLRKNLTIDNALSSIASLEDNADVPSNEPLVKWKSYIHQVVVESGQHFYKIYEVTKNTPMMFDHIVRVAVAQVMQEIGVDWKLVTFDRGRDVFDFEQREKLRVATPEDGEFEEILVSMASVYSRVHEILEFGSILKQLQSKPEFKPVNELQLTRSSVNKFDDYAFFDDQVVLLDDADFYITLLDASGQVLDVPCFEDIPVKTSSGDFNFKKYRAHSTKMRKGEEKDDLEGVFHGWILLPQSHDAVCQNDGPKKGGTSSIVTAGNHLIQEGDLSIASQVKLSAFNEPHKQNDSSIEEQAGDDDIVLKSQLEGESEDGLYEKLEQLEGSSSNVWLKTEFNPNCATRNHDSLVVWGSHMKATGEYFPNVHKQTTIFLTDDFCNSYVDDGFSVGDFASLFSTAVRFLPPNVSEAFPSRKVFRKFLLKFLKGEPNMSFLFSRYFCELGGSEINDVNQYCDKEHSVIYDAYCDCHGCMVCDFLSVKEALL